MELKYKVGDRVKIKTWEVLERESGLGYDGYVSSPFDGDFSLTKKMESMINEGFTDRILTIERKMKGYCYYMEGIEDIWAWSDYMIEGIVKEKSMLLDSMSYRFEIMDFDG